ncbi:Sterol desaturase-related protein [Lunatimonas lonarensis]|uniref:Sterol desaturase-related protein n=1 Tax=Lunatimonas lonarensis TaxID=1232681 RepID=R7ZSE3_9BACT|nr:sterol desaturase family protein [Lunatimonas lonarensis]EON77007.1 Sterol desaturase-related protein [Lunatimonas lonarensis]
MELYAKVLNYTMPVFLLLILVEQLAARRMGKQVNRSLDSVSSISSGMTNVIKDVLGLTISLLTYDWLVGHVAIFKINATWLTYAVTILVIDFKGYWVHRWEHRVNILWNRHVIHHSSEEFNLSCALRQTVSTVFDYFAFLLLPAAVLGVPVEVMAVVAPIHLFLQFWYHTRLIGKMGVLEKIIVTPSHHRVHHAINPIYMDRNFGQLLILWDKWFGTFQEELEEEPCVYGITRPARTWNPLKINFQHFWLLLRDAYHARSWKDKLRIWFMPTGWRPEDVKQRYPVYTIADLQAYAKYDPPGSSGFSIWAWTQLLVCYGLLIYLFAHLVTIGFSHAAVYGGFLVLSIYAFTELMDRNPHAWAFELVKATVGLGIIYWLGDWFGASQQYPWLTPLVGAYQVLSFFVSAYFSAAIRAGQPLPEAESVHQHGA